MPRNKNTPNLPDVHFKFVSSRGAAKTHVSMELWKGKGKLGSWLITHHDATRMMDELATLLDYRP
jgi:hypothetical protein